MFAAEIETQGISMPARLVAESLPVPGQGVVTVAVLERMTETKGLDDNPECFQVDAALAKTLEVPLECLGCDYGSRRRLIGGCHRVKVPVSRAFRQYLRTLSDHACFGHRAWLAGSPR